MEDHFSARAAAYAQYRPVYPPALYDFIYSHLEVKERAWDCATGNGQVAVALSHAFSRVEATDISAAQLEHAVQAPNIHYSLQPAEKTSFPSQYFDLVTVAQALHWLQFAPFFAEVKRVSKTGGLLAVWTYGLLQVSPEIDDIISRYYYQSLHQYWAPERRYVDDQYKNILIPFPEIECPPFEMAVKWNLATLEGYLSTWSALQQYIRVNKKNPLPGLINEIKANWGQQSLRDIRFPVFLRLCRI